MSCCGWDCGNPRCRSATTNSTPRATRWTGPGPEMSSPCPCTRPVRARRWSRSCRVSSAACKLCRTNQEVSHMIRRAAPIAASIILAATIPALAAPTTSESASQPADPVKVLVGRLDLEKYKATIKGLTKFGDRRQGTDRNRAAVDWIEAQLKSYGCSNIARIKYTYFPSEAARPAGPPIAKGADMAVGGGRYRGVTTHTGVNVDPALQPDEKLRALNSQPSQGGEREEVY